MVPRVERKLAAILALDVVGYSRLMAADEAGTFARLKALRTDFVEPEIAAHHGRVVKLMGDGALVEFASVVDAVNCAAAIQKGVVERQAELPDEERIAFRIAINIGDVLIEEVASASTSSMWNPAWRRNRRRRSRTRRPSRSSGRAIRISTGMVQPSGTSSRAR